MNTELEAQINAAEEQLRRAMLASDVSVLDELLAPDLLFTNHLGQSLGKEADLSAHKSGALGISKLEPSEQQVKLVGRDVAVVSVRVQVAGTYAGQPAGGDFRFTRVWALSPKGQWQVVAAHSGIIA
ncbi:nuclear transport factor 2 family protein [Marinimicrobium sp. ABcell2]|uniref:nuclear transport factor 2 family protein n=1 Tax=Marinimicrobium sp. ABcell2 TaxID=3069751 RepID=UPI0027B4C5A1|nr:nuclear transport factor 2 family protein [Marinimicrobium sp. ABcell2]MDQ2077987.1 nuclear transport factor 2 family protein [Marinimicrobium sp. ABcell2]